MILSQNRNRDRHRKEIYGPQGGKWVSGINWKIGIDIYPLLCLKEWRRKWQPTEYPCLENPRDESRQPPWVAELDTDSDFVVVAVVVCLK